MCPDEAPSPNSDTHQTTSQPVGPLSHISPPTPPSDSTTGVRSHSPRRSARFGGLDQEGNIYPLLVWKGCDPRVEAEVRIWAAQGWKCLRTSLTGWHRVSRTLMSVLITFSAVSRSTALARFVGVYGNFMVICLVRWNENLQRRLAQEFTLWELYDQLLKLMRFCA